jgi:hypothetical protein
MPLIGVLDVGLFAFLALDVEGFVSPAGAQRDEVISHGANRATKLA